VYLDALADALGESKSELRRLAAQGAISEVGGDGLADILAPIERTVSLRIGKHRFITFTVS
jgi:hypothetical protein